MTTTTATRPAHLAAVRVGKGTATHAGHLTTFGTPDAPRYSPLCGAGNYRYPYDDSPLTIAHGAPVADRVTCRSCTARYSHAVATIHDAQDADRAPLVEVEPLDVRDPVAVWNTIRNAGRDDMASAARRLRRAWINSALRAVYGLAPLAHDGRSVDQELAAVRTADTRDAETRAREYLAAYAAVIDDRAETVDRLARRFAAPDDAAQVAAGDRPAAGTWVTVEGHAGRWQILHRSPVEQRRYPYAVRVQAEGHPLNGSVPLDVVTPCPAPGDDNPDGGAWLAVQTGNGQTDGGTGEWNVYAADGGAYVGELWHNTNGQWSAYRRGFGSRHGLPSRGEALAAVGWLDTIPARGITDAGRVRLVLPDGSTVQVERAEVEPVPRDGWPGRGRSRLVDVVHLTVYTLGGRLDLGGRRPLGTVAGRGRIGAEHSGTAHTPTYRLTFPAAVRLALTPACGECGADPGRACGPFCCEDPDLT